MSIAAYRQRQEAAEQPRELERRAFSVVIGKLVEAKEQGGRPLVDACFLNHQLWSALLADLALPQNALPDDLKARLISLALWVQHYTPGVMRGTASPDPLISVNRNILDGLSTGPAGRAAPSAAASSLAAV
jgi:flagellar protein FlaF